MICLQTGILVAIRSSCYWPPMASLLPLWQRQRLLLGRMPEGPVEDCAGLQISPMGQHQAWGALLSISLAKGNQQPKQINTILEFFDAFCLLSIFENIFVNIPYFQDVKLTPFSNLQLQEFQCDC